MNKSKIIEGLKNNQFTLIAEIGVNYYDIATKLNISLMEAAKFMVLSAHNAGIHAVKFQTYKAETLASKHSPSYWDTTEEPTRSQYELFKKFDAFEEKEYRELSAFCEQIGIEFCSTPFDFESADYLESMMNIYKISSSDLSNIPFIEYIAKKDKPILLSVGASNLDEIQQAVGTIRKYNQRELALLHCVLEYPTPYDHANLSKITSLNKEFPDVYIGYSDHTKPDVSYDLIKTAYLLGASIIEKHFTLDKSLTGNDHYHAMDDNDAKKILEHIKFIEQIKGNSEIKCLQSEQKARENARRSIVAAIDIAEGTVITRAMLTFKRPGNGISPTQINQIIGRKAKRKIEKDSVFNWEYIY
jgi:N-acetylneuraminate synthase